MELTLIPGFMVDETIWDEFIACLPDNYATRHAAIAGGDTIAAIAYHIGDNLPDDSVVVGFSLGGYIARQLAADYPQKVKALVIIASSLREDTDEMRAAKTGAVQTVSASTFKGFPEAILAGALHPSRSADKPLLARLKAMGARLGYDALVTQCGFQRLAVPATTIRCPTLIVASTNDTQRLVEEADELATAIPGAEIALFHNSGHMIPLEEPEKLAATVLDWLKKTA